ncbi:MAG: hypothetical protein EHM21_13385 [Chloroflexi bacterium]|nr:MAG: hypothetical protein EHM21_13385 [Chloroflexota bacterium]
MESWSDQGGSASLEWIEINGEMVRAGDRVRLRPQRRADAYDLFLSGRTATVEAIEQDYENRVYLAVTIDDDPGADFGLLRQPGHRFFYTPDEVELVSDTEGGK